MAGPHVVGVVALLWQAHPALVRDIAATEAVLNGTANPNITVSNGTQCGGIGSVPNNHFGYGLVDALAAYNGGGGRRHRLHPRHHLRHLRRGSGRTLPRCRRRSSGPQRRPTARTSTAFGGYSLHGGGRLDARTRSTATTRSRTRGRRLAPMPQPALVASAVYYPPTNKIYVFGGATRTPDPVVVYDTTQIYDIASNTWTIGRVHAGLAVADGRRLQPGATAMIYLNGGFETSTIDSVAGHDLGVRPGREHVHRSWPRAPHAQGGPGLGGHQWPPVLVAGGRTNPDATLDRDLGLRHRVQYVGVRSRTCCSRRTFPPVSSVAIGKLWSFGGGTTTPCNPFDGMTDRRELRPGGEHLVAASRRLNHQAIVPRRYGVGNTLFAVGGRDGVDVSLDTRREAGR